MDNKTLTDLDSICESVFLGKPLTEAEDDESKKKDNENPFADEKDDEKDEGDKKDDSSDDSSSDDSGDAPSPFGGTDNGDSDKSDDAADDSESADTAEDDSTEEEVAGDTAQPEDDTGPSEVAGEINSSECDFGIEAMMLSTQVHLWHINCTSSGDHDALRELYYRLSDLADRILEDYVSRTHAPVTAGSELNFDFGDLEFNKEEAIGILEDVRDESDTLAKENEDNQTLCTILGEVSEALSTAIYKLSRFE